MPESPSGYFPDYGISPTPALDEIYQTEIATAYSGREQREERGLPRRFASMATVPLPQADRRVVYDFLRARKGAFEAFYLFNPVPESVVLYNAGSVTAANSLVLPWKGPWCIGDTPIAAAVTAVTIGGNPVATTSTPNIGPGGEDRLNWGGAPLTGVVIATANLARLRWIVRNNDDHLRQTFEERATDAMASFPLSFIELISS